MWRFGGDANVFREGRRCVCGGTAEPLHALLLGLAIEAMEPNGASGLAMRRANPAIGAECLLLGCLSRKARCGAPGQNASPGVCLTRALICVSDQSNYRIWSSTWLPLIASFSGRCRKGAERLNLVGAERAERRKPIRAASFSRTGRANEKRPGTLFRDASLMCFRPIQV